MYDEIANLIRAESASGAIFADIDVDEYLRKLVASAEFCVHLDKGRCAGFVAYYCNDETTRIAYITLILLAREARGSGIGRALTQYVIGQARERGFVACRLQVRKSNPRAQKFYRELGFEKIGADEVRDLMEFKLQ